MGRKLDIALFGWIDQAVLEIATTLEGSFEDIIKISETIDSYRPDQAGDMALAIAKPDWSQFIGVEFNFEAHTCSVAKFTRKI